MCVRVRVNIFFDIFEVSENWICFDNLPDPLPRAPSPGHPGPPWSGRRSAWNLFIYLFFYEGIRCAHKSSNTWWSSGPLRWRRWRSPGPRPARRCRPPRKATKKITPISSKINHFLRVFIYFFMINNLPASSSSSAPPPWPSTPPPAPAASRPGRAGGSSWKKLSKAIIYLQNIHSHIFRKMFYHIYAHT